jgi:hypothetical protein
VTEGERGEAFSMHGRVEKCIQYFRWETLKEETTQKT